jgi:hypothetical protein
MLSINHKAAYDAELPGHVVRLCLAMIILEQGCMEEIIDHCSLSSSAFVIFLPDYHLIEHLVMQL